MNAGLNAVLSALDAASAPVTFFVRDDDAGWADARLFALLDCTERARVPIDLAVIPQAANEVLAAELRARVDAASARIGLHQHGWTHDNHEVSGRKCEFGGARDQAAQRRDLTQGRARLTDMFGTRIDAIFTPPWNRCSPVTSGLLAELGYAALSRDRGAPAQHALPELAVDVDWCKLRGAAADGQANGDAIAFNLAGKIAGGATLGLMLHHAQMDDTDLDLLSRWLSRWSRHPKARWTHMRELVELSAISADMGESDAL